MVKQHLLKSNSNINFCLETINKKKQKALKGKHRGRPFPLGKSGNPRGRPPGARNKLSLMVEEGIRRAEAEMAKLVMLDLNVPYGVWDGCYEQFGRIFRFDTLQLKNPEAFILPQLKMVDVRRRRRKSLGRIGIILFKMAGYTTGQLGWQ